MWPLFFFVEKAIWRLELSRHDDSSSLLSSIYIFFISRVLTLMTNSLLKKTLFPKRRRNCISVAMRGERMRVKFNVVWSRCLKCNRRGRFLNKFSYKRDFCVLWISWRYKRIYKILEFNMVALKKWGVNETREELISCENYESMTRVLFGVFVEKKLEGKPRVNFFYEGITRN